MSSCSVWANWGRGGSAVNTIRCSAAGIEVKMKRHAHTCIKMWMDSRRVGRHLHIYNPRYNTFGDSNCVHNHASYLSTQLKFQIEFDCSREEHSKHSQRPDSIEGRILRNVSCNLHCPPHAILCISICWMSLDFEEFLKWGVQESNAFWKKVSS